MRTGVAVAALTVVLGVAAACSSSPQRTSQPSHASDAPSAAGDARPLPWDRPPDQQAQVIKAGLSLTSQETLTVHYHAHLDVFVDGAAVAVPAGLGINVGPDGKAPPHGSPGIAPLHTHDQSGVLHIEAPKQDAFTLGQVFTEWGVALSAGHVGSYPIKEVLVDGTPYAGDPAGIVLRPHEEIAVVAGTGNVQAPSSYHFPAGE
jgi:hypothetical protein